MSRSLVLAATLAVLSYVPFEYIAKITLFICAALFIFDPIPPISRIVALICVVVVGVLAKIERKWREGQVDESEQEGERDQRVDVSKKSGLKVE
uniref:Uncharacterized protein n=1 Tax=Fibrocapsa japonica TaxID=94617 RepID=A0A7S2V2E4_9STRA